MYKIAIVGASTLLGKELKDALADSSLAAAIFRCSTRKKDWGNSTNGRRDHVCAGDQCGRVRALDFTFFCGTERLTRKYWREAFGRVRRCWIFRVHWTRRRACWCVRRGWERRRFRGFVYAGGCSGASGCAGFGAADGAAATGSTGAEAAATVLLPASEFGRAAWMNCISRR